MHYFLIAGEASGDLHASHLISELRKQDNKAIFTFLGGDKMAAAAGVEPLVHYKEMNYMGISEVLRNLNKVSANLRKAKAALKHAKPDALILIDYPSFNLKLAAEASKLNIPVYYYISPKLWAWKKWRIKDIKKYVKRMLCILPFEPAFYKGYEYEAQYVGNPSLAEVDIDLTTAPSREEFIKRNKLRDRTMIALMPGSRYGEIRNNLPIMRLAADRFPQYRPIIIGAPSVEDSVYEELGGKNLPIVREQSAIHALVHCQAAVVTSGTATLEAALAGTPQVVCYRSNGAKISYEVLKRVLDIDFVSLPNLIANKEVVPEMLVHMCTVDGVADKLQHLLREDSTERQQQLDGYKEIRRILGTKSAQEEAAKIIVGDFL